MAGSRPMAAQARIHRGGHALVGGDAGGRHVPLVRIARGQPQHAGPERAQQDRRRRRGPRLAAGVPDLVVLAGEADGLLRPQRLQDSQRFLHLRHARGVGREREAVGPVFVLMPAGAQAENIAAAGQQLQRGGHLGQQRGVTKRHTEDRMAELEARMARRHVGQRGPAFQHGRVRELQMVDDPGGIEMPGRPVQRTVQAGGQGRAPLAAGHSAGRTSPKVTRAMRPSLLAPPMGAV